MAPGAEAASPRLTTIRNGPAQEEFLSRSAIGGVHSFGDDILLKGEGAVGRLPWLLWSLVLAGALTAFGAWAHHLSQAVLSSSGGRASLMDAVLEIPGPVCSAGIAVSLVGACGITARSLLDRRRSGD